MPKEILYVKALTNLDRYHAEIPDRLFIVDGNPVKEKYEFNGALLCRLGIVSDFDKMPVSAANKQSPKPYPRREATPEEIMAGEGVYDPGESENDVEARTRNAIIYRGSIEGIILSHIEPMFVLGVQISPLSGIPKQIHTDELAILEEGSQIYRVKDEVLRRVSRNGYNGYIDLIKQLHAKLRL